jgi:hypothetical protein
MGGELERRRVVSFKVVSPVWGRGVWSMKIVSWNTRGLGGLEKRKEGRKLVGDLRPSILCLQETKLQACDVSLCSSLWGNSPHDFSYRPSVGASGGILTLWDSSEVEVWSSESRDHVLWCHGRFTTSGEECFVANVYAPCEDGAKQRLWDSLSARLQLLGGAGCASVEISMLLNMRMNVDLLGLDLNLWITFLSIGSLKITTWWIFLCTIVNLPGSKGMASR